MPYLSVTFDVEGTINDYSDKLILYSEDDSIVGVNNVYISIELANY